MTQHCAGRIASLDLIRGVAVLGILAINVTGFAQPSIFVLTPAWPGAPAPADALSYAGKFMLFEGKMRALFSLLFGAGLALYSQQREDAGRFGDLLQAKRLGWLAIFGLAHFYLLWWGDILFLYACAGIVALMMRESPSRILLVVAGSTFVIWHLSGALMDLPSILLEERVRQGSASDADLETYAGYEAAIAANVERGRALAQSGFFAVAAYRLGSETFDPLVLTFSSFGETFPLMLIGMVLQRSGFFAGAWPRRRLLGSGLGLLAVGLAYSAALLAWAWPRGFPVSAMQSILSYWSAPAHLFMAVGYAALLVAASDAVARSAPGCALRAAGRMAFSNYLGTSVVMQAIFAGWGLGLFGQFGSAAQWAFVLGGWLSMLALSVLWLRRYRRGPLEWAWRSLVEKRWLTNRR